MTQTNETRRAGGAAGLGDSSVLGSIDSPEIIQNDSANQSQNRLRLQFLAARLHDLGPKPLFYFLSEIERGAEIRSHLEKYAQLPPDFIKAYRGDKFGPALHVIAWTGGTL